jgi:hypothetical protein
MLYLGWCTNWKASQGQPVLDLNFLICKVQYSMFSVLQKMMYTVDNISSLATKEAKMCTSSRLSSKNHPRSHHAWHAGTFL